MKKCAAILALLIVTSVFLPFRTVLSEEPLARVITKECTILLNGKKISSDLTDGAEDSYYKYSSCRISVEAKEEIGGIYFVFDRTPPLWEMTCGETVLKCGTYGFLHEYNPVPEGVRSIEMTFSGETSLSDICVLSRGDALPSFVQVWRPAEGPCDIMLLACHSDDDQLFFAGSVPDAVARGAEMQVCYFTNHWNRHSRPHELLNGLWTCGLDRYPVVGDFLDTKKGKTEEEGLEIFAELGITYDDMVKAQTKLLRKYKPQIVLVHDINGEYGHSAHRLDSHSLRDAALISANPSKYPDLTEEYGVWEVPKIYIHLYDQNKIEFEIDTPLERFGGRTAYQVSQDAFRCHKSQFNSRYRDWLIGTEEKPVTKSTEFPLYSPRYYGLWKSTVGPDRQKTDFYEHVTFYKDQEPPQPTTEPPTPTTDTPSPTTDTPTPTTDTPSPTTDTPSPTTDTPSPTTDTPSPSTDTSAPTTNTPAPTTDTPAPTSDAPTPTTDTPSGPQTGEDTPEAPAPLHRGVIIGIVCLFAALVLIVGTFTVLKIRSKKK